MKIRYIVLVLLDQVMIWWSTLIGSGSEKILKKIFLTYHFSTSAVGDDGCAISGVPATAAFRLPTTDPETFAATSALRLEP